MYTMDEFIAHHGILGQRWGIRRYQNKDGSLTAAGRRHWDQLDRKTKAKIKDNMIRSSNVKVLQAHQKYLTPNELRKATERLAANKRVSDFKEEEIQRGMQRIAELGYKAKQVGEAVNNITQSYNKIAKVINSVSGKDLPIIGEAKAPRKFSYEQLKNIDLSKLKGDELNNAMKAATQYNVAREQMDKAKNYGKEKAITNENTKVSTPEQKIKEKNIDLEASKDYNSMQKAYAQAAGRKDDISAPKKESEKMLPAVITPPPVIKSEASKPISAFKEHYTSDDINSAKNYVMSNFGNISYNSIGNYKYSNPSFSEQYRKMTERNNNRSPYFSHAEMSYDALIASFAN